MSSNKPRKEYWFYYNSSPYGAKEGLFRIRAKHRPSIKNVPRSGTFRIQCYAEDKWQMPCFPEITWGAINKSDFLGAGLIDD